MTERILAINPGSTSTKLALFEDERSVMTHTIKHTAEDLKGFSTIISQFDYRLEKIRAALAEKDVDLKALTAIVARGGNMRPVLGGTYRVNDEMVRDLTVGVMGQHASNLGGVLGNAIAGELGLHCYVVDPVIVDEFEPLARISGSPLIARKSKDHPLNQKAVARSVAAELGGTYADFNFIVAHMGGGISVGVHKKGRMVDVNNCLNGDGPMSPERSGGLPFGSVIDLCYSGDYTRDELVRNFIGRGGLVAYLGTSDAVEIERRIADGDEQAELIYRAMAYQVAKEIGAGASVLCGEVDAVILTGGIAHSELYTGWIKERVGYIAPVHVIPGEMEMQALVQGVLRVHRGEEELREYPRDALEV